MIGVYQLRSIFFTALILLSLLSLCEAASAGKPKRVKNESLQKTDGIIPLVSILNITPIQAEPGARILLNGNGFGDAATIFLGNMELPAKITGNKQVEFTVPLNIDAGLYALYLKRQDGVYSKSYNFTVLQLRPVLKSLLPSKVESCAVVREREISAHGSNFSDSSMLLLDGAVIPSTVVSSDIISFTLPNVPAGLHQIQVKNSPDNSSVSLTLFVESKPEISSVDIGMEHVNYYELLISGKNFNLNSSVYVDGVQIGGRGGQEIVEREKLIFIDCSKLIYQRHPYSPVNKSFRLQVVNPGGESSQVITVTAP